MLDQLSPEQRAQLREALNAALIRGGLSGEQIGRAATALQNLAEIDQPIDTSAPIDEQMGPITRGIKGAAQGLYEGTVGMVKGVSDALTAPPTTDTERNITGMFGPFGTGQQMLAAKRLLVDPTTQALTGAEIAADQGDSLGVAAMAGRAVPLVGPTVADIASQAGSGDVAGAVARGATLAALPSIAKGSVKVAKNLRPSPPTVAADFAKQAIRQLDDVKNLSEAAAINDYGPKPTGQIVTAAPQKRIARILEKEQLTDVPTGIKKALSTLDSAKVADIDTLRQVRDYVGQELRGGKLTNTQFRAVSGTYRTLTGELKKLYAEEGRLDDFKKGETAWSSHMKTFFDRRSPIKRALDAQNPAGGIDARKVLRELSTKDPGGASKVALERLRRIGAPEKLGEEATALNTALDRWQAVGAYSQQPWRQLGVQHAISYLSSRPSRFGTLADARPVPPAPTLSTIKDAVHEFEQGTPLSDFIGRVQRGDLSSRVPKSALRIAQNRIASKSALERFLESQAPPAPGEVSAPPMVTQGRLATPQELLNFKPRPFETAVELQGRPVEPYGPEVQQSLLQRQLETRQPAYTVTDRRAVQPQPGELQIAADDLRPSGPPLLEWFTGTRQPLPAPRPELVQRLFAEPPPKQLAAPPNWVNPTTAGAAEVAPTVFSPTSGEATATPRTNPLTPPPSALRQTSTLEQMLQQQLPLPEIETRLGQILPTEVNPGEFLRNYLRQRGQSRRGPLTY